MVLPRCPMCDSMWIVHNEYHPKPECETCGLKLRKMENEKGYEVA